MMMMMDDAIDVTSVTRSHCVGPLVHCQWHWFIGPWVHWLNVKCQKTIRSNVKCQKSISLIFDGAYLRSSSGHFYLSYETYWQSNVQCIYCNKKISKSLQQGRLPHCTEARWAREQNQLEGETFPSFPKNFQPFTSFLKTLNLLPVFKQKLSQVFQKNEPFTSFPKCETFPSFPKSFTRCLLSPWTTTTTSLSSLTDSGRPSTRMSSLLSRFPIFQHSFVRMVFLTFYPSSRELRTCWLVGGPRRSCLLYRS